MLNRLYIVVGVLAIAVLVTGFIVPRFIDWAGYRDRMEAIASEALGTEVEIVGDIAVTLLPQPRMTFSEVIIGPPETPVAMIAGVEAEFSLFDFLRDRYRVTGLVLEQPRLELRIGEDGALQTGIWLAAQVSSSNVSIENARIVGGMVRLTDARTAETYDLTQISGGLELSAMRGPFAFTGNGVAARQSYAIRVSTSALDASGTGRLSAFVRPLSEAFSLSAEGTISTAAGPQFSGDVTYRQAPPTVRQADNVTGDLVVTGKATLTPDRLLLTSYTVVPDENRAGTRLTGTAEVTLGPDPRFNAVVSGGVMALPPRDATAEAADTPYELVRLLTELPLPPAPGLAGTVGVDIAELDIRATALRSVLLDATTDGKSWTIQTLSALLPGNTTVRLEGTVSDLGGRAGFEGHIGMATSRLAALAALWRKPAEANPLVNLPAELSADLALEADTLHIRNGSFVLEGVPHAFAAQVGLGDNRHLQLGAGLGRLSPLQSAALAALVPDLGSDQRFGLTFPKGEIAVTAETATLFGLAGEDLSVAAGWQGGVLEFDQIAGRLGGAAIDGKLTVFGTLAKPEMFGHAAVALADGGAPILARLFDVLATPEPLRAAIRRFVPANLAVALEAPGGDGGQTIRADGEAGSATIAVEALLGAGVLKAGTGRVSTTLELEGENAAALSAQLGLGDIGIFPASGAMSVALALDGSVADGFTTRLRLAGSGDSVVFDGSVSVTDAARWTGLGAIEVALSDPTALVERLGAGGLALPAIAGRANLAFAGGDNIALNDLDLRAQGHAVTGALMLRTTAGEGRVSGELTVGAIDLGGLAALVGGPAALVGGEDAIWPIGPLDTGAEPRTVNGRVRVETPGIFVGQDERPLVADATFDVDWDATRVQIRALDGALAGGRIAIDAGLCCAGPLPDKRFTGRVTLTGADLDALLPAALATALEGRLDLVAQLDGTGDSVAAIAAALTGQGNFGVTGLQVERFDPGTFATIAALDNLLEIEPEALTPLVAEALQQGPFAVPQAAGSFTIAGGVVRSPNLALEAETVRLFGGANLDLADLTLDGAYTLSPRGAVDAEGLINERTSQIRAFITGTLSAPVEQLDVAAMVDGIKMRAYEIELAELERLRAEDEARVLTVAADRERLEAQQDAFRWAVAAAQLAEDRAAALATAAGEAARIAEAVATARQAAAEGASVTQQAAVPLTVPPVPPAAFEPVPQTPPTVRLAPLNLTPSESVNQF